MYNLYELHTLNENLLYHFSLSKFFLLSAIFNVNSKSNSFEFWTKTKIITKNNIIERIDRFKISNFSFFYQNSFKNLNTLKFFFKSAFCQKRKNCFIFHWKKLIAFSGFFKIISMLIQFFFSTIWYYSLIVDGSRWWFADSWFYFH